MEYLAPSFLALFFDFQSFTHPSFALAPVRMSLERP